jgi:hypothetical protein
LAIIRGVFSNEPGRAPAVDVTRSSPVFHSHATPTFSMDTLSMSVSGE